MRQETATHHPPEFLKETERRILRRFGAREASFEAGANLTIERLEDLLIFNRDVLVYLVRMRFPYYPEEKLEDTILALVVCRSASTSGSGSSSSGTEWLFSMVKKISAIAVRAFRESGPGSAKLKSFVAFESTPTTKEGRTGNGGVNKWLPSSTRKQSHKMPARNKNLQEELEVLTFLGRRALLLFSKKRRRATSSPSFGDALPLINAIICPKVAFS